MKRLLGIILCLFSTMTFVNASNLTENDLGEIYRRLSHIKDFPTSSDRDLYRKAFQQDYQHPDDEMYEFMLKSGIEVNCNALNINILRKIGDSFSLNAFSCSYSTNLKYLSIKLNDDFQDVKFDTKQPLTLQIRKKFGCDCQEKFRAYFPMLQLAFLSKKDCYIDDGKYHIKNIEFNDLISAEIGSVIYSVNTVLDSGNRVIRYIDPHNKGNKYGFFVRNTDKYHANYYSEQLIATFQVVQIQKEF